MQPRHGTFLDTPAESTAHDELSALAKCGHEGGELAEVISQVGVAHDDPFASHVACRVDVGATKSSFRRPEQFPTVRENYLRCAVGRTIYDQDLAGYSRAGQSFLTP